VEWDMSDGYCWTQGLRQACHDIRQPIAGVLALAEAALAESALPENARACLNQIVGFAEWQAEVIEHVLEVPADEPMGAVYTDVVRVVNHAAAAERVTWPGELTLIWPPGSVFVPLHEVTVRRMVANLLANAIRAAGPSGTVTIEVSGRDSWMLLAVEDDGPGFGLLPGGSGLGLSMVAREALRHRGRVECGRAGSGGARVSLWLPALAPEMGGRVADAACAV